MKNIERIVSAIVAIAVLSLSLTGIVTAEEVKLIASITKIELTGDSAKVTLKDAKTGKTVEVTVKDMLTIDKLKDKRIQEGDEVRLKYDTENGNNISKLLRKTAGC
jgi:predicted RecA/RadA family phage recombinase